MSRTRRPAAGDPTALRHLTGREASVFACLTDVLVAPVAPLPPVARTDAARALDVQLGAMPPVLRAGLRAALLAVEVAPTVLGFGARLRRLDPAARTAAVGRMDRHRALAPALKGLRSVAHLCYYGDPAVMAGLGYDADAVVARGARLRAAEGRW